MWASCPGQGRGTGAGRPLQREDSFLSSAGLRGMGEGERETEMGVYFPSVCSNASLLSTK